MNREDAVVAYEATVNYHNTLVQMRFSVAALFAAAAAFLVGALFADTSWLGSKRLIAVLGLAVTLVVWLLELRTFSLLLNLVTRGLEYESVLQFGPGGGFFRLLSEPQPIGIKLPFSKVFLPSTGKLARRVFSHTFGLDLLYQRSSFFGYTRYMWGNDTQPAFRWARGRSGSAGP